MKTIFTLLIALFIAVSPMTMAYGEVYTQWKIALKELKAAEEEWYAITTKRIEKEDESDFSVMFGPKMKALFTLLEMGTGLDTLRDESMAAEERWQAAKTALIAIKESEEGRQAEEGMVNFICLMAHGIDSVEPTIDSVFGSMPLPFLESLVAAADDDGESFFTFLTKVEANILVAEVGVAGERCAAEINGLIAIEKFAISEEIIKALDEFNAAEKQWRLIRLTFEQLQSIKEKELVTKLALKRQLAAVYLHSIREQYIDYESSVVEGFEIEL